MLFGVLRFARKITFLNKGGIRCISRSSRGTLLYMRLLISRTDEARIVLLVMFHGTNVQHIFTAVLIVHNMY